MATEEGEPTPWDKRYKESMRHWRYFMVYRDMWPRSLSTVAKKVGCGASNIEKLSSRWHWVERAKAWDASLAIQVARRVDDMAVNDLEAMKRRHIQMGLGMQTATALELNAWVEKIKEAVALAKEEGRLYHKPILTIGELIRLAQEGVSIERLNRDLPTDVTRTETEDAGLGNLDIQDLKELKKLKNKMEGS